MTEVASSRTLLEACLGGAVFGANRRRVQSKSSPNAAWRFTAPVP